MIPTQDMMMKLAEAVEKTAAKNGWDQAPMLAVIYRDDVSDPRGVLLEVEPYPVQPYQIDKDPAQGLLYLAGSLLAGDDLPNLIDPDRRNDVAGVLFLGEGWMAAPMTTAEMRAYQRSGRRLADTPGSRETRFVHVIDCGGRYYFVNRVRGEVPTSETAEPGDTDVRPLGNIAVGLRDLLLAIGRQLPFGSVDFDAVRNVGAESLDDIIGEATR